MTHVVQRCTPRCIIGLTSGIARLTEIIIPISDDGLAFVGLGLCHGHFSGALNPGVCGIGFYWGQYVIAN